MYALTEQQIDFILRDIKSRGVEMEDLQVSLLDHICCIIECELEPGGDFDSFYRKTIPRFFKKELREIEEETILLLTFKNYYAMRKTMIITGAISVAAYIFGSFLKIMHWPGASMMLLLGILISSLIFMPLLFILKTREANSKRDKIVLGVGVLFGILVSISTLFKVFHWPYSHILWLISLGVLFFLFVPIYFFSGIRNPETKMNTITSSILVLFAGGLLFTLTSLRGDILNSFIFPRNIIRTMNENIDKGNLAFFEKSVKDSTANEKIRRVQELSEGISTYILQLKMDLLTSVDPELKNDPNPEVTFNQKLYKDNVEIPTGILIGEDSENPRKDANSAVELKNKISSYRKELLELLDEKSKEEIDGYIGLSTDKVAGSSESWESYYFYKNPLVSVITTLDLLQNETRYAELVILTKLAK
jgi:hypothetical protein